MATEEKLGSVIRACLLVPAALSYCFVLPSCTTPGQWRLLAVLPVAVLFALIPFSFSTINLRGTSAFLLSWLANFKLLLFSLGRGPLPSHHSSLPAFVAVAALPIKIRQKSPPEARGAPRSLLAPLGFAAKALLLALIILSVYPQRHRLPRVLVLSCYGFHIYLALDMVLVAGAAAARALLPAGVEMAPQFAAPYLSTSLQDFWGRRWNLMVSDVLRQAVYVPVRTMWGATTGVMAAFLVSGLMHEVMFYYITMEPPTGEVGCFFALHGACVAAEVAAKRWWARRGMGPLHSVLSATLTVGFVAATGMWLFLPQITRGAVEDAAVTESVAIVGMLWRAVGGQR